MSEASYVLIIRLSEHNLRARLINLYEFCSISTGSYDYPVADATHIALRAVRDYLDAGKANPAKLDRIVFCVWSDNDRDVYR